MYLDRAENSVLSSKEGKEWMKIHSLPNMHQIYTGCIAPYMAAENLLTTIYDNFTVF